MPLKNKPASVNGSSPGALLAKLFRTILFDLGIDNARYAELMQRYISKANHSANQIDKQEARSRLSRDLMSPAMTIKTLFKGFHFLAFKRITFTISGEHHNGKITSHSVSCVIYDDEDEESTELDTGKE